ncbi:MAG: hypothetical protein RLO51_00165 [Thalassobaculum sp.]|uniref:hypothetical protein n=1 Tax=Thalassobaculum sp. TaxID=2022740 RepID=UPI0032EE70FC
MQRLILALMVVATTTGCGVDTLLQTPGDRREEVAAAVAEALEAEKGWQTRFVERRTEAMLAEQQEVAARTQAIDQRTKLLQDQLDDVARRVPSIADAGFGRAQSAPAPAVGVARAEVDALRQDLEAMTGAVAQLLGERERSEAETNARFERLELRTSSLAWPDDRGAEQGVHLASYRTHENALQGWEVLQKRHRAILGAETPTFVEVETVAGRYVRLFVGVGHAERVLQGIRDGVRSGGDYAMVLPLPAAGPGS